MKKNKRILITRTDRLGDVVLSTPVIRIVRQKYPDAYIAFMVRPENQDVVANNPHLNEIIVYDKRGAHKSFCRTMIFGFGLRKKKFDLAIALHPTNRVHLMLFLAGIPVRVGYDIKMGWFLTEKIEHLKQKGDRHEADYNLDLLKKAGIDVAAPDLCPYIITSDRDKSSVDLLQKRFNIGNNIIAIHAGASCSSKRWMPERFALVADKLSEEYSSDIILIGGKETSDYSNLVVSSMKRSSTDLTGMLSIGELAEMFFRCRLFISNDSGPVHIAAAVTTPTIAIFGRSDPGLSPSRWAPLGKNNAVIHKDAGCETCLAHNCEKDFVCLKAVTPEDVITAAKKILRNPV